jgi:hypothetical protein
MNRKDAVTLTSFLASTFALACGSPDASVDLQGEPDSSTSTGGAPSIVPEGGTADDGGMATPPVNGLVPCEPFDSGYEGDDLCILPPEPGTGLQLHMGPEDHDDPDEIARFLMQPGESVEYYQIKADNPGPVNFYQQYYRMRPGTHHLITYVINSRPVEETGWTESEPDYQRDWSFGGAPRAIYDFPPDSVTPPEDVDLARFLPANLSAVFEVHYVNATPDPILREVWANFMQTASQNIVPLGGLFLVGARFSIPPDASRVLNYRATLSDELKRIVSIFGHRHANTDRFTVWHHHDGERTLVYEDYDWREPTELSYNSVVQNPAPDREAGIPGGTSGILMLEQGDMLEWECEVNNRSGETLTFGNEVFTREMCNVFGGTAGGRMQWFAYPAPAP